MGSTGVKSARLSFTTQGESQILDITHEVAAELSRQPLKSGIVTLFATGSTAGVTTIENEPGLIQDFKDLMEKLAPKSAAYRHNRHGEDNGHSHLRASLLGPSLTVPFEDKRLLLGTWQQIVLIDFDTRPRSREIVLQFLGE